MAEIDLIKLPGEVLRPSLPQDLEKLRFWKNGELLRAIVRKPNNGKFHRKLFALLNVVFEGQERYPIFEHFRSAITVTSGFCEHVITPDGKNIWLPNSLAYKNMEQMDRERLYSRYIDVSLREFLPQGWTEEELEDHIQRLLRFDS